MKIRLPTLSTEKVRSLTKFADVSSRILYLSLIVVSVFLLGGFLRFSAAVNNYAEIADKTQNRMADGIVVLTGDKARIVSALHLLEAGNAKRLLISGVYPATSNWAISSRFPEHTSLFDCCIDFDRQAKNTAQNGIETAKWMKAQKFDSLIVVTSDYHLPRSLLELSRLMPDAQLIPSAVTSQQITYVADVSEFGRIKLLAREYFKTLGASFKYSSH